MTRDRLLPFALATLVVAATPPARPVIAAPSLLADSTTVEQWTLANGLRVTTRSIPKARDVSVTVGYRSGMDDDPANRQGLAQLMGDLGFTAMTADQPARTPTDLDRDHPQGWGYPVMRHLTLFTEVVPRDGLRKELAQCASRMRGVRFEAADLDLAVKRVRHELAEQYFGDRTLSLGFQVREIGLGLTDAQMLQRASGAGLAGLTPDEVKTAMGRVLVPANAVLSLSGDLHGVDLHAEIERLFGAIPGGTAREDAPVVAITPGERTVRRKGEPAAVIGVISPALSDSTHPAFYMAALLFASVAEQSWFKPGDLHPALFQYGVFDEPELVRFYPPLKPTETDLTVADKRLADIVDLAHGALIGSDAYVDMRASISWLLGGPMTAAQRSAARSNRVVLMTLSRAQASCELRRGHAFWERYLKRLMAVRPGQPELLVDYMINHAHQVRVMSLPSGK
ncbi:MAG: insulinase family protein [Candidatus Eisenbacteria bacterium]